MYNKILRDFAVIIEPMDYYISNLRAIPRPAIKQIRFAIQSGCFVSTGYRCESNICEIDNWNFLQNQSKIDIIVLNSNNFCILQFFINYLFLKDISKLVLVRVRFYFIAYFEFSWMQFIMPASPSPFIP